MPKKEYAIQVKLTGKDLASAVFRQVKKSGQELGRSLVQPFKAFGKLATGMKEFVRAVPGLTFVGAGLKAFGSFLRGAAQDAIDYGSKISKLSDDLSLSRRTLQQLAYVGEHAGLGFEKLESSLINMQRMARGVTGKQLFAALGQDAWSFARAVRTAKNPSEQLELILSMMASLPADKRAAFAQVFFGAADGAKLAGQDIKEMRAEFERLGLAMSDEDLGKADEFDRKWGQLQNVFASGKRDLGLGFIEGLLPALDELLGYTKANRKEVGKFLRELGRDLGKGIIDAAKWIIKAVRWIVDNKGAILDVAKGVGIALGGLVGLNVLGNLGGMVKGLWGLGGATAAVGGAGAAAGAGRAAAAAAGAGGGLFGGLKGLLGGLLRLTGPIGLVVAGFTALVPIISDIIERVKDSKDHRTPEQRRLDTLIGSRGGVFSEYIRQDQLDVATLGGALPHLAKTPNIRDLDPHEAEALLLYGRVPTNYPRNETEMSPEQRQKRDDYLSGIGYTRTREVLGMFDELERTTKVQLEVNVKGDKSADVEVPKLPPDVELKIKSQQKGKTGPRAIDYFQGGGQ